MAQDEEVFEINDYTVVTELEKFVVCIESLVQEWNIGGVRKKKLYPKGSLRNAKWCSKTDRISFGDSNKLRVSYFSLEDCAQTARDVDDSHKDYLCDAAVAINLPETDFVHQSDITTLYGVVEYLLFAPDDLRDDRIVTEDQKNLIISGFRMAAQSSECEIPMFLQFDEAARHLYFGFSANKTMNIHFEGAHIIAPQKQHSHESGLLNIFKEKVKCPISLLDADDIRVSVQFEFTAEKTLHGVLDEDDSFEELSPFDFSSHFSSADSFKFLTLIASWPNVKQEMINENEVYTDLEPQNAFNWDVSVLFDNVRFPIESAIKTLLEDAFTESSKTSGNSREVFGIRSNPSSLPFRGLSLEPSGITIASNRSSKNALVPPPSDAEFDYGYFPLAKDEMQECILQMFASAMTSAASVPGSAKRLDEENSESPKNTVLISSSEDWVRRCKAAPLNSLTARLATAALNVSPKAAFASAQVWHDFVAKLRWYYDNNEDLPGLEDITQPTHSACLLHQKIEMLQCCINARKKRHELFNSAKDFGNDEFFDADSDFSDDGVKADTTTTSEESKSEAVGRLHPFADLKLLHHPTTALYVPITQDGSPMTEDMSDAHAVYLSSLNDSDRLLAQMDTLESDIQAFKAANPLACLEDFIRWHSPKDWDAEAGSLSERMLLPDNAWIRCWEKSLPIPVLNQKRLFNEAKIAEEILAMFENASYQKICQLICPVVCMLTVKELQQRGENVKTILDTKPLLTAIVRATRTCERDDYLEVHKHAQKCESVIVNFESLKKILQLPLKEPTLLDAPTEEELRKFICALLDDAKNKRDPYLDDPILERGIPVVGASNSPIGNAIRNFLVRRDGDKYSFPPVNQRNYVFRWNVPCPGEKSRIVPQRMFASIGASNVGFRLAGSFSEDSCFR